LSAVELATFDCRWSDHGFAGGLALRARHRHKEKRAREEDMARRGALIIAGLALIAGSFAASAQELPKTHVKVIGYFSNLAQTKNVEEPFWKTDIPKESKGQVTADYSNVDVLGVSDFQVLRMTKLGVTDFGTSDISKMAGDDPVFEGCDLAGISNDIATARKACDAWKPVMAEAMAREFNTKLLGLAPNPPIVFWCREPIKGVADLKGKKIRVFNKSQTEFIAAIGGTTVTMTFPEVVPALQRGVVDCALTGTLSGNTAGWPEVSKVLYPLNMGWSISYQSANLDSWKRFAPAVQEFFAKQFVKLENDLWAIGEKATEEGVSCNTGKGACTLGKVAHMSLVPVSEADKEAAKKLEQSVVLIAWGKRCGKPCAQKWNDSVGKIVGLQIPIDKL
jgi:TRAP-type transport system periplasmic protein